MLDVEFGPIDVSPPSESVEHYFRRLVAETIAAQAGEDYADPEIPPNEAFDLPQIFNALGLTKPGDCQFMVFFTSELLEGADEDVLTVVDSFAHAEAASHPRGGLNLYVKGKKVTITRPDGTVLKNRARSSCSWNTQWQAEAALDGPNHKYAVSLTRKMYKLDQLDIGLFWAFRNDAGGVDLVRPDELNDAQSAKVAEVTQIAQAHAAGRIAAIEEVEDYPGSLKSVALSL